MKSIARLLVMLLVGLAGCATQPEAWDVASDDEPGEFVKVAAVTPPAADGGCAVGVTLEHLWSDNKIPVRFREKNMAVVYVRPKDRPRTIDLLRDLQQREAFDILILE